MAKRAQKTLKNAIEFRGVGLHTGEEVQVRIEPAAVDHGVIFTRVDLDGRPSVPMKFEHLSTKERRTALRDGAAEVCTVEHLLAALSAYEVDNVSIEMSGEEVPGLDGSSLPFVELIEQAGVVEQKAEKRDLTLDEPLYVRDGDTSLIALPAESGLSIEYHLVQPEGDLETIQSFSFTVDAERFKADVAPARTFVMEREIEQLQAAGLGKGANSSNTLVMTRSGPRDNELRFPDELARHKVLDLIGDLALTGVQIHAHLIATRSGHRSNHLLVKQLLERMRQLEDEGYLTRKSGMNIRDILGLLPHRYPFLLVDRVVEIEGYRRAVGIKNVTFNEPFFQGHWPGQPIMPGVLQLEAMAQMAGLLLFRKLENTGKLAVLWSIDRVKLRGAVTPGDQLRIEVETIRSRPGMGHVQARCKVAGKLVAEAQLKFTLVDA
ncbi:MAG: 3-hydroxyacyl-[acyl-carrier-protein] dehydratase FabZ [Planctomycetota bacterium]|nr:MAG: 3-hydroxyacyl-[acyl-carrier-protein] dehydratase FabZ [Planctomycetota bacterium]